MSGANGVQQRRPRLLSRTRSLALDDVIQSLRVAVGFAA
jgi:hypothetical protein